MSERPRAMQWLCTLMARQRNQGSVTVAGERRSANESHLETRKLSLAEGERDPQEKSGSKSIDLPDD